MFKYLLLIICIGVNVCAYAQAPIDSTSKRVSNDSTYRKAIALRFKTAGQELTSGSNLMLTGTLFMVAGGVITGLSDGNSGMVAGGLSVSGLGLLFDLIGIGKIGVAGKRLRGHYK